MSLEYNDTVKASYRHKASLPSGFKFSRAEHMGRAEFDEAGALDITATLRSGVTGRISPVARLEGRMFPPCV